MVPGYLLFNILQSRARHIDLLERVSVAAAVKALKARLVTPCQADTQATPDMPLLAIRRAAAQRSTRSRRGQEGLR